MKTPFVIALAGNPNSGKTSVFNRLTGSRQHVGNYPGVTVEKKEGICFHDGAEIQIVDLPGTYSLTAYSLEEMVARDFLVNEKPDAVINVVDASNIERNLYLTTQLIELGVPLVLAFNMSDVAKNRGYEFDLDTLSSLLGAPIVQTIGTTGEGLDELMDSALRVVRSETPHRRVTVTYGTEIEEEIEKIQKLVENSPAVPRGYRSRWLALKLIENDSAVAAMFDDPALFNAVEASKNHINAIFHDSPEIVIAGRRYGFISGACQETVRSTIERRHNLSDQIDTILAHQVLGIPIFLVLMYLVFHLTFSLGEHPMRWLEISFAHLANAALQLWPNGKDSALCSLVVDGIIGGVGGVIVFLPNILLLFLAIALLEDSGYMARAAFVMDRFMHKFDLHGKSFMPMLIGFGCSVPAIMATRTLDTRRDRLATMFIIPLVSCGARLTIYTLLIPAFFAPAWRAPVLMLLYLIGIALALLGAKILRRTLLQGESTPFVMELPPYRMPTLRGAIIHMWDRGRSYLWKAGTVILGISIVLWAATTYPRKTTFDQDYQPPTAKDETKTELERRKAAETLAYSTAGRVGHLIEPLLRPMGFDWKIGTALIGAVAAKEVFVAQLGIVYSLGAVEDDSEALRAQLRANYSPLTAFCIMLFCLIGSPCIATIAITKSEANSWKWAALQWTGLTALAYVVTVAAYQIGSLLAFAGA